jgi:hypothetical protein
MKGRIVLGSDRPNLKHYILTEDGFFQLGAELEESRKSLPRFPIPRQNQGPAELK